MTYRLVIANKALSSWSLRPWLVMKHFEIPFEEICVRFRQPDSAAQLKQHSPSGLVPVLYDDEQPIWDSLAIAEYLADQHPDKALWPKDRMARAQARCLTAEMHAGFSNLRTIWPMDAVTKHAHLLVPSAVEKDLSRIFHLWETTLSRYGGSGPFLFGDFTIADAFYAPIMLRIRPYGPVKMSTLCKAYYDAVLAHPCMMEWCNGAEKEKADGWYD